MYMSSVDTNTCRMCGLDWWYSRDDKASVYMDDKTNESWTSTTGVPDSWAISS